MEDSVPGVHEGEGDENLTVNDAMKNSGRKASENYENSVRGKTLPIKLKHDEQTNVDLLEGVSTPTTSDFVDEPTLSVHTKNDDLSVFDGICSVKNNNLQTSNESNISEGDSNYQSSFKQADFLPTENVPTSSRTLDLKAEYSNEHVGGESKTLENDSLSTSVVNDRTNNEINLPEEKIIFTSSQKITTDSEFKINAAGNDFGAFECFIGSKDDIESEPKINEKIPGEISNNNLAMRENLNTAIENEENGQLSISKNDDNGDTKMTDVGFGIFENTIERKTEPSSNTLHTPLANIDNIEYNNQESNCDVFGKFEECQNATHESVRTSEGIIDDQNTCMDDKPLEDPTGKVEEAAIEISPTTTTNTLGTFGDLNGTTVKTEEKSELSLDFKHESNTDDSNYIKRKDNNGDLRNFEQYKNGEHSMKKTQTTEETICVVESAIAEDNNLNNSNNATDKIEVCTTMDVSTTDGDDFGEFEDFSNDDNKKLDLIPTTPTIELTGPDVNLDNGNVHTNGGSGETPDEKVDQESAPNELPVKEAAISDQKKDVEDGGQDNTHTRSSDFDKSATQNPSTAENDDFGEFGDYHDNIGEPKSIPVPSSYESNLLSANASNDENTSKCVNDDAGFRADEKSSSDEVLISETNVCDDETTRTQDDGFAEIQKVKNDVAGCTTQDVLPAEDGNFGDFGGFCNDTDGTDIVATSSEFDKPATHNSSTVENDEFGEFGDFHDNIGEPKSIRVPSSNESNLLSANASNNENISKCVNGDAGSRAFEGNKSDVAECTTQDVLPAEDGNFGDFGGFRNDTDGTDIVTTANGEIQVSNASPDDDEITNQNDDDDDFGAFEDSDEAAAYTVQALGTNGGNTENKFVEDKDEFGDFEAVNGEVEECTTQTAPTGADDDDDDGFGDFEGNANVEESTVEAAPTTEDEDMGEFGDFNHVSAEDDMTDSFEQYLVSEMQDIFKSFNRNDSVSSEFCTCKPILIKSVLDDSRTNYETPTSFETWSQRITSVWLEMEKEMLGNDPPQLITNDDALVANHRLCDDFGDIDILAPVRSDRANLLPNVRSKSLLDDDDDDDAVTDPSVSSLPFPSAIAEEADEVEKDDDGIGDGAPERGIARGSSFSNFRRAVGGMLRSGPSSSSLSPTKEGEQSSAAVETFLERIPDLSFMLQSNLSLPKVSKVDGT